MISTQKSTEIEFEDSHVADANCNLGKSLRAGKSGHAKPKSIRITANIDSFRNIFTQNCRVPNEIYPRIGVRKGSWDKDVENQYAVHSGVTIILLLAQQTGM